MSDMTRILSAIERGDVRAVDELFPLFYQNLRQWLASGLAIVLIQQGKLAEAEPFYREAIENASKARPNDVARWKWQVNDLVDLLLCQGKQANAEEIVSKVLTHK